MHSRRFLGALITAGVIVLFPGGVLAQEKEQKEGQEPMPPPKPPAELKQLQPFVGQWKEHFKFSPAMMPPDGGEGTGVSTCQWVLDGWFLYCEMECEPTEMGIHKGKHFMWYDTETETFHGWGINNMGEIDEGEMTYDESQKTWLATSTSKVEGQLAENKSTIKMVSPTKLEWEWHMKGPDDEDFKLMMTGTSEKVRE